MLSTLVIDVTDAKLIAANAPLELTPLIVNVSRPAPPSIASRADTVVALPVIASSFAEPVTVSLTDVSANDKPVPAEAVNKSLTALCAAVLPVVTVAASDVTASSTALAAAASVAPE